MIALTQLLTAWRDRAELLKKHGATEAATAVSALADELGDALGAGCTNPTPAASVVSDRLTWRERLWTAPADTRIGAPEVAEALGRSVDYIYRHTGPATIGARIPHRKLDGELTFRVADLRAWLTQHEIVVEPVGPTIHRKGA